LAHAATVDARLIAVLDFVFTGRRYAQRVNTVARVAVSAHLAWVSGRTQRAHFAGAAAVHASLIAVLYLVFTARQLTLAIDTHLGVAVSRHLTETVRGSTRLTGSTAIDVGFISITHPVLARHGPKPRDVDAAMSAGSQTQENELNHRGLQKEHLQSGEYRPDVLGVYVVVESATICL